MDDMSIQTTKFTRADYMALPEGFPAQLIRGQLIKEAAPTPWHQVLVNRADLLPPEGFPVVGVLAPVNEGVVKVKNYGF